MLGIHRTVVDGIATSDKVKTCRLREMIDSLYWRREKGFSLFFFPLINKRRKAGRQNGEEMRETRDCQAREGGFVGKTGGRILSEGGIVLEKRARLW